MLKVVFCLPWIAIAAVQAFAETGSDWHRAVESASWAGRIAHTSVSYDDKIWILGGNYLLNDVWCSSDGTDWHVATASAEWSARSDHASAAFDGKMWVLGGRYERGGFPNNEIWSSTDGATWTAVTLDAPWIERWGHAAVVHDEKLWVLGGFSFSVEGGFLNDVWCSSDGIEWVSATMQAEWEPREQFTSVSYAGKIWVMAGNAGRPWQDLLEPYNDVWSSTDGVTWIEVTPQAPWEKRSYHTSLVYRDRIWLLGGGYPYYFVPLYAMTSEVWWTTDGLEWNLVTDSAKWGPRGMHSSVVHQDKMWILGGGREEEPAVFPRLNDVWHTLLESDLDRDGNTGPLDIFSFTSEWQRARPE